MQKKGGAISKQQELWRALQIKMQASQKGDQQAYRELMEQLYPIAHNFLKSKVGPMGHCEDWTQECLIAIHKSLHTYLPDRPFRAWFYAVIRYKCIDLLRKQQKLCERESLDNEKVATFSQDDSNSSEEADRVNESIDKLPGELLRAVKLTKIEGLSTKEAAAQEGISETALRTRVSRAYKLLRTLLERESA